MRFCYEGGKPATVSVFVAGSEHVAWIEDNRDGRWRPCVTHVQDLVRMLREKKPKGNFAKARVRKSRPQLKIFNAKG